MYSGEILQGTVDGAELVYVQKLKEGLNELSIAKQSAINNENYHVADQLKDKILILQDQIDKVENHFTTDLLQNCITNWQSEIIAAIQDHLATSKRITGFLDSAFHVNFVNIVKGLPLSYYDSLIRAVMILFPHELPDVPKSPYGWEFFARKIHVAIKSQDTIESIKTTVLLLIMDIVTLAIGGSSNKHIKRETYDMVLRHIFHFIHNASSRKLNSSHEGPLFDKAFSRCAIVVGYIAQANNFRDIFRYILSLFDSNKKVTQEEVALAFSLIRYSFFAAANLEQTVEITEYLKDLQTCLDKAKKTVVKVAIIQSMERAIQPQQTQANKKEDSLIWGEVMGIYRKAKKWITADELKPSALSLMTTILLNSKIEFFAENVDSFISNELCPKSKIRDYAYLPILQLLRGRYFRDTIKNFEKELSGADISGEYFGSSTRTSNEETPGIVVTRLHIIADMMFLQRKGEIPTEKKCIAALIVAQMASYNIVVGAKLISQLLDTSRAGKNSDCYFVGLRALRIIVDPESGFQKHALSKVAPEFSAIVSDHAYNLTPSITSIYEEVQNLVGVDQLGTAGRVLTMDEQYRGSTKLQESSTQLDHYILLQIGSEEPESVPKPSFFTSVVKGRGFSASMEALSTRKSSTGNLLAEEILPPTETVQHVSTDNLVNSVLPLNASEAKDIDESIAAAIMTWFQAVGAPKKDYTKYLFSSSLVDDSRMQKKPLKADQQEAMEILRELIPLIRYVPAPEFVAGSCFIGTYLSHSHSHIALATLNTLFKIFMEYPELRLGIVNGFVNFLKSTKHRDDITIATNMLFFSRLIKSWVNVAYQTVHGLIQFDNFNRVSCKIDAICLLLLVHPNNVIRKVLIHIIMDFKALQKTLFPDISSSDELGEMSLADILEDSESIIIKQAVYGFLESGNRGVRLDSKVASSLRHFSFLEVASSNFSGLFKFYLGELAKRFSYFGRMKASRHLAKFLRFYAIPLIERNFPDVSIHFKGLFSSYMILLMSLAGVALKSEHVLPPRSKTIDEVKPLLFGSFQHTLSFMLTLEKSWQSKAILGSFYFLHRDVVLAACQELMLNFQEVKVNPNIFTTTCFLFNLFTILRVIIQYPHFELLIQDNGDFSYNLIQIYADFISFISQTEFADIDFLKNGTIKHIKTAIDISIITHRLCDSLNSIGRLLLRQARYDGNTESLRAFENAKWRSSQRKPLVGILKIWYKCAGVEERDPAKVKIVKSKLINKISIAMEEIMLLGDIFDEKELLPPGLLFWLVTMESEGYRVFVPEFMYRYDDALGTVLSNSYGGKGKTPFIFSNAIFDQILPRLDDGPHMYLFGNDRRASFAEPFFSVAHGLPPVNLSDLDSPSFLYPDISTNDAIKLREHLGSLLFYGLYNLMSIDSEIRIRSLVFLRELLQMFNPEEQSFDVQAHLKSFNGAFYSGTPVFVRQKLIELSATCSELFASDCGSFLWEAVRCARSSLGTNHLLLKSKDWVIELMFPWCQFVNLGSINIDQVNAEFFRFLMDNAFDDPDSVDDILNCWIEVCRSEKFGMVNAAVLMDVVVEVSARFPTLQRTALLFASALSNIHPELVSSILTFHLSSSAFPWHQKDNTHSFRHTSNLAIKDYIHALHQTFKTAAPESENGYRLTRDSAALLISQILPQRFQYFINHAAVILNFILVKLEKSMKKSVILFGCVQGFISYIHGSDLLDDPKYQSALTVVRKFLGWLSLDNAQVIWHIEKEIIPGKVTIMDIPIQKFIEYLITIFRVENINLSHELAAEFIKWASEGYLNHEESIRSIKCYYILLETSEELPAKFHDMLYPRILDQISVIAQMEVEARAKGWDSLPKGKIKLLSDATEIIMTILKLHSLLLKKFVENGTLETHGKAFWITAGILRLPIAQFSGIISLALDNMVYMLQNLNQAKIENNFLKPLGPKSSCDLQLTLLPIIFSNSPELREKALLILLQGWVIFPPETVDLNETGIMYTLLYSLTWIFIKVAENDFKKNRFPVILQTLGDLLVIYFPSALIDFQQSIKSLKELSTVNEELAPETQQMLFDGCVESFIAEYGPKFGFNISNYLARIMSISALYRSVGLKLAKSFWNANLRKEEGRSGSDGVLSLLRFLPFLKNPDSATQELILQSFPPNSALIMEIDVASHGKIEHERGMDLVEGSARSAWNWLSRDMGLSPSKAIYAI